MPDRRDPQNGWPERLRKYWSVSVETGFCCHTCANAISVTYLAPVSLSNPDPKRQGKGGRGKQTSIG